MDWVIYTPEKLVWFVVLGDGKTKKEEPPLGSIFYCIITWQMASYGKKDNCECVQRRSRLSFLTKY